MAAIPVKQYQKQPQGADPESTQRYLDSELNKIRDAIKALTLAVQQLQTYTGVH